MNQWLLAALIFVALCAATVIAQAVISAVENVRIAKHTGTDPRREKLRDDAAREVLRS